MPHADIIFHRLYLTVAPVGVSHVHWCKSLPFFNHMFSITLRVHRTNLSCNSMRTQRGRSGGWGSPALSCDSWVAGVSLGPKSTQWLLCTCQSSCDADSLLGDASRGEWGERSSTKGQSPSSRWLPPAVFERKKKKRRLTMTIRRAELLAPLTQQLNVYGKTHYRNWGYEICQNS